VERICAPGKRRAQTASPTYVQPFSAFFYLFNNQPLRLPTLRTAILFAGQHARSPPHGSSLRSIKPYPAQLDALHAHMLAVPEIFIQGFVTIILMLILLPYHFRRRPPLHCNAVCYVWCLCSLRAARVDSQETGESVFDVVPQIQRRRFY
jgi:hypothetical protein